MKLTVDNIYGACTIVTENEEIITKIERAEVGYKYEILYNANEMKKEGDENIKGIYTFTDYSCDLGINYSYRINDNQELSSGTINYEDIILYDNSQNGGAQLIRFNPTLTSLKKNQAETVTQTLGNKYPIVRKNGNVDYYTFSLGGLISTLALKQQYDDNNNRTLEERNFRNNFIKTLSNGKIKLFKAGPEGLMLVRITNVSLNSEPKLGRDIYSFSATVTEVAEANINNLRKFNIYSPADQYFKVKLTEQTDNYIYFIVRG